jgi:hypothetical protein
MRKSKLGSPGTKKWGEIMLREGQRELPQRVITEYLDLLEKKGLLEQHEGYTDPTETFRELFVKAVESLRNWYKPFPGDEPQTLIAQEMARLILKVTPAKIEQGLVKPEEVGRLSNVLVGLLRHYFKEHDTEKLMDILLNDDGI